MKTRIMNFIFENKVYMPKNEFFSLKLKHNMKNSIKKSKIKLK